MQIRKRKRFIAGAICPQCKQFDTIALCYDSAGEEYITCVHCHYRHTQHDAAPVAKSTSTIKPITWQR